jgi:hypothetical protein
MHADLFLQEVVIATGTGTQAFGVPEPNVVELACGGTAATPCGKYMGGQSEPNGQFGVIAVGGSLDQWTYSLTGVGVGFTFSGPKIMELTGSVTSTSAGDLDIYFTDTRFTTAYTGLTLSLNGTSTAPDFVLDYTAFVDDTFAIPAQLQVGELIASGSGCSSLTCVFSSSVSGTGTPPTPYSATEHLHIYHSGAGTTTFSDPAIIATPEPASVILIGSLLPLIMLPLRRKRRLV